MEYSAGDCQGRIFEFEGTRYDSRLQWHAGLLETPTANNMKCDYLSPPLALDDALDQQLEEVADSEHRILLEQLAQFRGVSVRKEPIDGETESDLRGEQQHVQAHEHAAVV